MGDVVGGTDRVFVVVPVGIRVWLLLPTPLAAAQKAKQISTTVMAGTSWGSERAILKTRSAALRVCLRANAYNALFQRLYDLRQAASTVKGRSTLEIATPHHHGTCTQHARYSGSESSAGIAAMSSHRTDMERGTRSWLAIIAASGASNAA